ncbi:MAG: histidine phosphatase family protein [Prevotella sp.]|nr:histidine phosphatase family protein [Prevotella sp.]MCM1074723.1 histidine phosphatase family protein [Ruminococcus sp.]
MKFKIKLICLSAIMAFPLVMSAQTTKEEVLQDLNRTGGVYYAYPVSETEQTPAPKGYEPFYVSHFGRHGSRYLISDNDVAWVARVMQNAADADALTPLGKDVLNRLNTLMTETEGRSGDLSPLGVRQHKGIANRMAKSYPQIFKNNNAKLTARSTLVPRCILSMAAFCEALKEQNPKLQIDRESSDRYVRYLNYHTADHGTYTNGGKWKVAYENFKDKHTNPERLINRLFSNPEYVKMNINPHELMWGFYWIASDMQNVETPGTFYDIFTPDELFDLWQVFNFIFYVNDGAFSLNGTKVIDNAIPQLANIIESADAALSGNVPAADLRFAHDGNLIPLAAILQLKDCNIAESNPDKFYRAFSDWKIAPMAGNIQLIFYRNKKNPEDVLVKFMLNERETSIPIQTDSYPYYHWNDVKTFYTPTLERNPAK